MNPHRIYTPFITYFRRRRLRLFYRLFNITTSTKLIDIGGTIFFWKLVQKEKLPLPKITIVNLFSPQKSNKLPPYVCWVVADRRYLPFGDFAFDIAFSNSVIEHLGNWGSQHKFANEIKRIAPNYSIETPNKKFPIEPHLITPFIHRLPKYMKKHLIRNFTIWGLITRPTFKQVQKFLDEVKLLTKEEMSQLFPNSTIITEKFLGLPKSLIAIKKGP